MRRTIVQAAFLLLFVAVTLPPLVVLCRGRSPSRFSAANLPAWERKAPLPAHPLGKLRALPLPPGAVQFDNSYMQALRRTNEDKLLAGIESPPRHPTLAAGSAGLWLEAACALGRKDRALAAKQDRVALRLMTAEDADGYLAAGQGRSRWTATQVQAESRNLRGLLACYGITHHVAVIYAAMQAGDLIVSAPELAASVPHSPFAPPLSPLPPRKHPRVQTASLVLPITRLYLMTGQERYRHWALGQAKAGRADGPGLCALFLATGQPSFLRQAQAVWKKSAARGKSDPDAAACLLAATGSPGYARVLRSRPAPWPCPLAPGSLAYMQTPKGLTVNIWVNTRAVWHGSAWTQRAMKTMNGPAQTTLTLSIKKPLKATLLFPIAGETVTALVGGARVIVHPGQAVLAITRVWHNGDRVLLTAQSTPALFKKPLVPGANAALKAPGHALGKALPTAHA